MPTLSLRWMEAGTKSEPPDPTDCILVLANEIRLAEISYKPNLNSDSVIGLLLLLDISRSHLTKSHNQQNRRKNLCIPTGTRLFRWKVQMPL